MKIGVFYSGQFRSFDKCYNNHLEKIFSVFSNNYDVYMDVEVKDLSNNYYKSYIENSVKNLKKYKIYDTKDPLNENIKLKPSGLNSTLERWLRQVKSVNDSFKSCEQENYDVLLRIRTDSYFLVGLEELNYFDFNFLYIPNHDNWFGINDRFAISNFENMKKYFSFYPDMEKYGELSLYNAESYLKYHLDFNNLIVRRTKVIGQTIREDGTEVQVYYN